MFIFPSRQHKNELKRQTIFSRTKSLLALSRVEHSASESQIYKRVVAKHELSITFEVQSVFLSSLAAKEQNFVLRNRYSGFLTFGRVSCVGDVCIVLANLKNCSY